MVGLSKRSLPEPNLCMAVVTFSRWMKFYSVNIQIKAFHQFSPLLPFVFQYFATMTFVIFHDFFLATLGKEMYHAWTLPIIPKLQGLRGMYFVF